MAKRTTNIMQRGSSYLVHVRVNGHRVWRSFKSRDEAELFLARQMELRARGMQPERRVRVTFGEAAEAWYRERGSEKDWSPSTRRDYRSVLDVHLLPAFEDVPLEKLTAGRIAQWRAEQMSERAAARQDATSFLTAAFAGLRRGELVALRVRDVDFDARTLRVEGSYALGVRKAPKCGKVRSVPMAAEVEKALARHLLDRGDPGPDELVFAGEGGGYLDASALRRRYLRAQKTARLRPLRFHDLRHTFGSLAITRASLVQVQSWMGHANAATTMRYLHHKSHAAEAELLDGRLPSSASTTKCRIDVTRRWRL